MRVLQLEHEDFVLSVECRSFEKAFRQARVKQPGLFQSAQYRFTSGHCSVWNPDQKILQPVGSAALHPVFFENKEYTFDIEFADKASIRNAHIYAPVKTIGDKFLYRPKLGLLSGVVNFGNDLGRFDLVIRYEKNAQLQEFILSVEVFPIKLDYRTDYLQLIADIEREYPLLVLSFLEKTYSSFRKGNSVLSDLIWWQIFGGLYEDFSKATRHILNKPHSRLIRETHLVKAEKLQHLTPALEEEISRYRHDQPERLYHTSRHTLTTDTPENRFLKYALNQVGRRFSKLHDLILDEYSDKISDKFGDHLAQMDKWLKAYRHHPFFRSIGDFKGIRQESLVLQKATGYSTIYKCWIMLRAGISFFEGMQKLELKNIAELYEIWCFLEMKRLVQNLVGKKPAEVKLARIRVDDFIFEFASGEKSKVSFVAPNGDLIDLYHEFHFPNSEKSGLRSFTVGQEPDIVLQITKNDLRDNYVLTYLYDAKYRLQSDEKENAADFPPKDAINQMHHYRDAIYYANKEKGMPEREVLGGYVLFPGAFIPEEIRDSAYYRSIQSVNIGAFPLRPNDRHGRLLLQKHLRGIIRGSSDEVLKQVLPHKGNKYEPANPEVFVGIVKKGKQSDYFEKGDEFLLYHTGEITREKYEEFLEKNPDLRYFAPCISGKGVREYYEIRSISFRKRKDIFPEGHELRQNDDTERIVLSLGNRRYISEDKRYFKFPARLYSFVKLAALRKAGNSPG